MEELAMRIFGTRDYNSVLNILPPYDGMVKEFHRELEKIGQGDIQHECNQINSKYFG